MIQVILRRRAPCLGGYFFSLPLVLHRCLRFFAKHAANRYAGAHMFSNEASPVEVWRSNTARIKITEEAVKGMNDGGLGMPLILIRLLEGQAPNRG